MYKPSLEEFLKLSRKANVIPVYKEISADLDTPVSSYLKMKKGDYAFLLESVEGQEKIARYSFLGANPCLVFTSKGRNIKIISRDKKQSRSFQTASDPLTEIKKLMKDFKAADVKGLPRFYGGFVGYIGYDMVRFFEDIPDKNPDDLGLADSVFMLTDTILLFDHVNHNIKIICNSFLPCGKNISDKEKTKIYHKAIENIEEINKDFNLSFEEKKTKRAKAAVKNITSNFQKSEFCSIVDKAKEYIRKGDIIQVVLSQRFKIKTQKDPFDIYRDLRSLNPSPYMFFLKLKDFILVGSSPEMLVRCENGILEARPIAGTRRRGTNDLEDSKLAKELLQDKKERAEHVMLVDLARNDLGRVAKTGNVTVGEFMRVERYSHVMHIVSDVTAELNPKNDAYDVLRACFPAGTVSGSPKIRAMEIIDELENTRRGPYAGCVGYFSFSQNMDTCITIRTIVIKGNTAYIQAGAGIVLDSIGENEYLESINKAKALVEAINRN
ncbi:anthranilate synthase component I [bacterium]|nr:MAG: anthranilate synthase component I [bacterium]